VTIINLRGTNGAAKSTAVRTLMKHIGNSRRFKVDDYPSGYRLDTTNGKLFVMGNYAGECGGIDRSFSYKGAADHVMAIVDYLADQGSVIWEGVAAYSWKRYSAFAKAREAKGDRVIFALLDTPLETCIQNTERRRAGSGKRLRPLNPEHLIGKYEGWIKNQQYIADTGCECHSLPWQNPLPTLLEWLALRP
jgi:hypothetical protein